LTELILSAHGDLADLLDNTSPATPGGERLTAIATALRTWALGHPQRYLLLYGTPCRHPGAGIPGTTGGHRTNFANAYPSAAVLLGGSTTRAATVYTYWTRLHGVISLEITGHFIGIPLSLTTVRSRSALRARGELSPL
jgi:hypothetical protein